jgi:hypothetical protein
MAQGTQADESPPDRGQTLPATSEATADPAAKGPGEPAR